MFVCALLHAVILGGWHRRSPIAVFLATTLILALSSGCVHEWRTSAPDASLKPLPAKQKKRSATSTKPVQKAQAKKIPTKKTPAPGDKPSVFTFPTEFYNIRPSNPDGGTTGPYERQDTRYNADRDRVAPTEISATPPKKDVAATVRVYFGSDRNRTGSANADNYYGFQRSTLSFGYSDVTIPHDHRMGNLESPLSIWLWKPKPDPTKHVVVASIAQVSRDEFFAQLQSEARGLIAPRQAFVFVHGYATAFHDAVRRAAQIKYDLSFPGLAVLYSWPSTGDERNYGTDEDSIAWSANSMREFLTMIAQNSGADEIFLIGHSMGTRGLAVAISSIAANASRDVSDRYKQIILAAPDIDRDIFRDQIFPAIKNASMALTVYASDRDKALDFSRIGHSYPRLGSTSPTPFILDGLTTIDASSVDTSFWGHSYYAENRSIISDMYYLIRNTPLVQRFGLQSVDGPNGQYWRFKQ